MVEMGLWEDPLLKHLKEINGLIDIIADCLEHYIN
jgi:hypothetical protein